MTVRLISVATATWRQSWDCWLCGSYWETNSPLDQPPDRGPIGGIEIDGRRRVVCGRCFDLLADNDPRVLRRVRRQIRRILGPLHDLRAIRKALDSQDELDIVRVTQEWGEAR